MNTTPHQPATIEHNGTTYTLHQTYTVIDAKMGISTGPFYSRAGVDPEDWAFLPDAYFLLGKSETPRFMHCIQQRANVRTDRPS